mgnify:CR=1 FL=1
MKNILKTISYALIITLLYNPHAFPQTNMDNLFADDFSTNQILKKQFSKERQLLSVNLIPSYSVIFPTLVKNLFRNIKTFSGLANLDIGEYSKYFDYIDLKGGFWYVPNISYTILLNRVIGIEFGIGAQSVNYSLLVPKDKVGDLIGAYDPSKKEYAGAVGSDTYFKASFYYIPIHIGLKIISGKTHKTVNTFRFGIETVIYNIETLNGVTGIETKRTTAIPTFYISYELGWQIDIFPRKDWRVKPYIDFSLFEIGYYIKSSMSSVYNNAKEGVGFFGSGLLDINSTLPAWNDLPKSDIIKFATSLKIAFFPRVGITIRF